MRRAHRVRQPQHTTWVGVAWVLALLTPFWSLAATTVSLSAPTANQTYKAPASVTLTAQASTDSGTISQVRFYRGTTLIGTVTAPPYSVTWSTSTVGSYNLTAKATDSAGKVTTSPAVPVTVVANQAPTVSLSSPAPNQVLSAPATVTLTATATDSDGTISKVEFYRGTTLIGTTATAPYTVTWSNAAGGSYSLTAKATDNNGKITTSAAVPIVVNAPPTVSLSSPAANAVLLAGATVTLTATAADKGGSVSKVEFYQGTTLLGTKTASPYTFAWTTVPPGSYTLTGIKRDGMREWGIK